jgi:hypothetical protein
MTTIDLPQSARGDKIQLRSAAMRVPQISMPFWGMRCGRRDATARGHDRFDFVYAPAANAGDFSPSCAFE